MSCSRHLFHFCLGKQQEWRNERTCSHFAILVCIKRKRHPCPLSIIYSTVWCLWVHSCVCVCPPVVYILIPSGGLFTPPAGTSSHIVDHPWLSPWAPGVGWHERATGGTADARMHARTHTHTDTQLHRGMFCRCWKLLNMSSSKCSL